MAFNPLCWVRCADCGHREMIRRSHLDRRCRVRCGRCGGPVEPSQAAAEDLMRGRARAAADQEKSAG